ncbi:MAG: phage major capsid protein [Dehalococcoidia bacterium]
MPDKLVELREKFQTKQKELHDYWEEAGDQLDVSKIKSINGLAADDTTARVAFMQSLNKEVDEINKEIEPLAAVEQMKAESDLRDKGLLTPVSRHQQPGPDDDGKGQEKSLGRLFVESASYKAYSEQSISSPSDIDVKGSHDIDLKAVFRTAAGWEPENIRMPRVELDPQRPIAIVDRIPQIPTSSDAIRYMEETTFDSSNAVETAESTATTATDLIGEANLALTERSVQVEWLPVFLPVTMQQLEDVAGIEEYINSRLTYMLRARLDSQILNGSGVTPNLLGTVNVGGINTQAKGIDPTPDAIYKGLDLCRTVGFANPSDIFMHPTDWQPIRLLRTADGIYILGSPNDPGIERLWGVPLTLSTAVAQNTAVLGDYRVFSHLYQKRGITLAATDSHGHYFTRGMLAIRADMRIAMVHYRPEAFCTVTGI